MATHSYKDLQVWQKAIDLVVAVYEITNKLPSTEKYGLADQLKRAVVSVPSNIAEGQKRYGAKEFKQFCYIANASLAEVETQLILVNKLFGTNVDDELRESEIIGRMLLALIKTL